MFKLEDGDKDIKCEWNEDDVDITNCRPLQRLSVALKYYSMLDIMGNAEHSNIFSHFINEVYVQTLDDYNHLISEHSEHLNEIKVALINKHNFKRCHLSKCCFTSRHHQSQRIERNDDGKDIALVVC